MVADDRLGLSLRDIERVLNRCRFYRFLLVELALDFSPASGVDERYVKRHGRFGKSRRRA